jgi:ATP-dependent DNA ligase
VEAELEPNPWSPEAKAKLAGNLYNNNPLPFGFTIKPFDYIPANEFFNQAEAKTPFSQRATALVQFIQGLAQAGLTLSCPDTVAMTTEEAETAFAKGIEEGLSSHRVIWQGKPVEGIVLRDPNAVFQGGVRSPSAIKRKPNIDVDILVTHTGWQPKKGAVGMQDARPVIAGIDTKRPENFYVAYGGISKEIAAQLTALKGTVVEINILTTDDPKKGMGNPTFVRTRPDKESHIEPSPKVLEEIRAALEKKGVVIATDPPGVEL